MEKKTGGTCYEEHANIIVDWPSNQSDGVYLVHGSVWSVPWNKRVGHCWIEMAYGELVLDTTVKYFGPADRYYEFGKAEVKNRYNQHKTMLKLVETGHFGPWENAEKKGD